jgi:hypothetical protein
MSEINSTVEKRRPIYGDFERGITLRGELLDLIKMEYAYNHGGQEMPSMYEQMFYDILNKIIRVAVTPTHIDSWHDIQGYALRIEDMLRRHLEEEQ